MTSIRKFAYAALLVVTTLNLAPSIAAAQEPARGRFTLAHDVHWGNAKVPAGEYEFFFDTDGISPVLRLNKLNGHGGGFMLLVPTAEETRSSSGSRLLLESTAEGSYVSAMQLPEFGMTLRFAVPTHATERQIAKGATTAPALGQ
jgi:hypothetical protein